MKVDLRRCATLVGAAGCTLVLFAASPAIRATDLVGTALAADTPPAVAQPVPAANNPAPATAPAPAPGSPEAAPAPAAEGSSSDPLAYHRDTYVYASRPLRDPFGSLLKGRFVADGVDKVPDIGSIDLVGVMWGESDKFALCEDLEGHGYVLRVGDPVQNGEVAGISKDTLTIRQYFFGTSTTVTLKLKPREGKNQDGKNRRR